MSRPNLGKSFYGFLDRGFWGSRMAITLIVSDGLFPDMLLPKLKFNRGYGIESKGGLF